MDGSRCHAGEKNAISLHFPAAFFDIPRTKVIYAAIGERQGWFQSIFREVGHFLLLDSRTQSAASDAVLDVA